MRSPNIRYLPEVDHLRAIAALWILVYHGVQLLGSMLGTGQPFTPAQWSYSWNPAVALVREGHTAVALFMALSGFIFTYGSFGRPVDYRTFVRNRVLRIYPLYGVVLLTGIAAYPHLFRADRLLTSVLPLANIAPLELGALSTMFWAIAVECQFYLLFPALLAFISPRPVPRALQVVALALLLRGLASLLGGNARDLSYFHLVGRIDQFVAGMVAAILLRQREPQAIPATAVVTAGSFAIAVLFAFHRLGGWPSTAAWKILWPPVEGVMWATAIATYVGAGDRWPATVSSMLARIGSISFSIYLWHFAVITILADHGVMICVTGQPSWDALLTTVMLALPVTLTLSAVSYRVVEAPFLALRRSYLTPGPERRLQTPG